MLLLSKAEYGETLAHLESIPGVGPKTAMMMALITDNFRKFDNYKQLIAYIGFSPRSIKVEAVFEGKDIFVKWVKLNLENYFIYAVGQPNTIINLAKKCTID